MPQVTLGATATETFSNGEAFCGSRAADHGATPEVIQVSFWTSRTVVAGHAGGLRVSSGTSYGAKKAVSERGGASRCQQ